MTNTIEGLISRLSVPDENHPATLLPDLWEDDIDAIETDTMGFALANAEVATLPPVELFAGPTGFSSYIPPPTQFFQEESPRANSLIPGVLPVQNFTVNFGAGFTPAAQAAFQFAVGVWDSLIDDSSVNVEIDATFQPAANPNNLGSAGPDVFYRDFAGAPQAGTFYPVGLVNQILGSDENGADPEINANFNSARSDWYFGTDGNPGPGQFDFTSVVLHEIGHGLGFLGSFGRDNTTSIGTFGIGGGFPVIFDRFVENGAGTGTLSFANGSVALGNELVGNNLFFDGPLENAANSGNPARIFAPNPFNGGSSLSHLNEATFGVGNPNSLMTPFLSGGEAVHNPGPITLGILQDIGWSLAAPLTPTISISPPSITQTEGDFGTTAYNFTVTLDQPTSNFVVVNYTTNNGTATAGSDYIDNDGSLVFIPGNPLSQTITVLANGDTTVETNEFFNVSLNSATNATLSPVATQSTGFIDNDDVSTVAISPAIITQMEGDFGTTAYNFTVSLDRPSAIPITVNYSTNNGTATAGSDYIDNDGTLTFNPGNPLSQTLTVFANGDTTFENDEDFTVNLNSATNATINAGANQSTGIIENDDPIPTVSIGPPSITQTEGNIGTTAYDFTVSLSNASAFPITVDYTTDDGSATTANNDYVDNDGFLTFNPGDPLTQFLTVEVNGDTTVETDEDFSVRLINATNANLDLVANQSTGIIDNDDFNPVNGTPGIDFLVGTNFDDRITGFQNADRLVGRGGDDLFVYQSFGDGVDTITDFELGGDRIDVSSLGVAFADIGFANVPGGTLVSIASTPMFVAQGLGVTVATMNNPANFMF